MKRDVPAELRDQSPQPGVITTKLRKKDIEDLLLEKEKEKDAAATAADKLVEGEREGEGEGEGEGDEKAAKEKAKKESGIRTAYKDDPLDRLDRFERREVHDTLPAPPDDSDE